MTFILAVFPASSGVSMNLVCLNQLKKLWIIQMVWQLCIYCFLNKVDVVCFILNIWCIENPYKKMDMWATSFLKFNTYCIIFCFIQWTTKYDLFKKILQLYTEIAWPQVQGYYLTNCIVLDSSNFSAPLC